MSEHPPKLFPPEARLGMVIGLIEVVAAAGGRAEIAQISRDLQTDIDQILPVVEAAEQLGLITVEDGECIVTPLGQKLSNRRSSGKKQILRKEVAKIEPFATAIKLSRELPEGFTAEEVASYLSEKAGISLYAENVEKLHELLVDWLLYAELLEYNGDSKRFKARGTSSLT
ncbi:MAG: AAA-associated domain-containing protein [Aigarchaeota archaeon]|nr:AAA-associated domain-containing protein [Candidatus Pelearchaeum maunauluense]